MYDRSLVFRERELLHDVFSSCFKALIVKLFCLVDKGVDNEHLTPKSDLVAHEFVKCRPLALCGVDGLYRLSSRWKLVDDRYVEISIKSHRKCTGNRCRGHDKYMRRSSA